MSRRAWCAAVAVVSVLTACTSTAAPRSTTSTPSTPGHSTAGHSTAGNPPSATHAPTPTPGSAASADASVAPLRERAVWLCRPGRRTDPCSADQAATVIDGQGRRRVEPAAPPRPRDLDCFYVYPTVSDEHRANADRRITDTIRTTAVAQASRFSSVCRVWAPVYRQRTVSDLFTVADAAPDSAANRLALASVEAAWRDFLAQHDPAHRIVLIGHSQGAALLVRLIRAKIDADAALRRRIALALLLGANVTVASGRRTGGSFENLPLCDHTGEAGCVIAYSSFPGTPPATSLFGRPGQGVSTLTGDLTRAGREVACVDPAAPQGGRAPLHPYVPSTSVADAPPTPWTAYPGALLARCRHRGTASWLEVTPAAPAATGDGPRLEQTLGPDWGYHLLDVNLALGDLVASVAALPA
jgi:hypothetical protein